MQCNPWAATWSWHGERVAFGRLYRGLPADLTAKKRSHCPGGKDKEIRLDFTATGAGGAGTAIPKHQALHAGMFHEVDASTAQ